MRTLTRILAVMLACMMLTGNLPGHGRRDCNHQLLASLQCSVRRKRNPDERTDSRL